MTQTEAWIRLLANATKWLMLWQRTTELGLTTLNRARHCKTILIYCIWYMDLYYIYMIYQTSTFSLRYGSMNSMHILAMSCLTLQESTLSFKKAADLSARRSTKSIKNIQKHSKTSSRVARICQVSLLHVHYKGPEMAPGASFLS